MLYSEGWGKWGGNFFKDNAVKEEKGMTGNQKQMDRNLTLSNRRAFSPSAVRVFTGLFGGWIGIIIVIKIVSMVIIAFSKK